MVVGHEAGRRRLSRDGEIVFERETASSSSASTYPGLVARRIDYGHALIGPGFIDLDALS